MTQYLLIKVLLNYDFGGEYLKKDTYKSFPEIFKEFSYSDCFIDKEYYNTD